MLSLLAYAGKPHSQIETKNKSYCDLSLPCASLAALIRYPICRRAKRLSCYYVLFMIP